MNSDITNPRVLLITETGEKRGEVTLEVALMAARTAGLDLVEVAPNPKLPVVKILDYGKVRFENQKKKAAAKKRQKTQEVKEIKMRPNIDTHDYDVKGRAIRKFIERGDKVKVTIRFRGREMAHMDRGMDLLKRVKADFEEIIKIEFEPKTEGRLMTMVIAPK
ncbi:MAG: translation initiation factor IF-3 [Robiginitomaculum sp.]